MGDYLSILLTGGALFAAVLVLLTAEPKISRRLTAAAGAIALAGGLLIYGWGYIATTNNFFQAAFRTVFAVFRMFVGESDFGDINEAPMFAVPVLETLCWCFHVLAVYATSSAAISLIGANALKNLRIRFSAKRNLSIIYGVNEESMEFGQALAVESEEIVVFVQEDPEAQFSDAIIEFGGVLRTDAKAIQGNKFFLKSLGIRKGARKITLYTLCRDHLKNLEYAKVMLEAFEQRNVQPQQISLVIHGREDEAVKRMQVSQDRFGYGFVTVFQEPGLTARLLIRKYPPCRCVSFDAAGIAQNDFEAVIVGFGRIGQAVLRNIIMNAQFPGSRFRADVFDLDYRGNSGFFANSYKGIFDHYQVEFHSHDGRSTDMYDHLNARLDKINYIVICTGSEETNDEIAEELRAYLLHRGKKIEIHQCSGKGIRTMDLATSETTVHGIYHPDILATGKLDNMAMAVNHYYMGEYSKGILQDWMDCDYFSRMSSRAFADSLDAVLSAAGRSQQQAMEGDWEFSLEHLDNLSQMEHARWNAFHFCMGFMPMSREEYDARADAYRDQVAREGKSKIRIGKNMDGKTHACLVSWDELDELSARENGITGGNVDYKQMDRNNILLVPKLLEIWKKQDSKQ